MKTMVVSKSKKILADFNVGTIFDAINVIKNNNLSILMMDNDTAEENGGVILLEQILKYSKNGWIKLPQQIIIIESDGAVKREMDLLVTRIYKKIWY